MGQPFLLAPSGYDSKQPQLQGSLPFTPSSASTLGVTGLSPPLMRDLEQLKLQYDRIYQQISQTLHQHQLHQSQKDKPASDRDSEEPHSPTSDKVDEEPPGETSDATNSSVELESAAKRPRLDTPTTTSS